MGLFDVDGRAEARGELGGVVRAVKWNSSGLRERANGTYTMMDRIEVLPLTDAPIRSTEETETRYSAVAVHKEAHFLPHDAGSLGSFGASPPHLFRAKAATVPLSLKAMSAPAGSPLS